MLTIEEPQNMSIISGKIPKNNMMEINRDDLWDIDEINIDKEKSIKDKLEEFVSIAKGDLSTHLNEDYVVRVHFSQNDYSATDAMKYYMKQIAELKY
ncbi:hypothetical protein EDD76_108143 [Kineothrix alysoides]|uniref:DUF6870 domain-containing protein n=1 Tax=Kineothrix alysoides TaxID=1469948 RepID=A0A4R1QUK5_9FIRM|nr:hypothetical protein [Kineothrix alysoides]TCL57608.1 hypothetical protein EDD76_108143 [Kineothrix alysoides]